MSTNELAIKLVDLQESLVRSWHESMPSGKVEIIHGDIFSSPAEAIVSPANSFGFMDGGIDLVYSRRFGWAVQTAVQAAIARDYEGELLVGQALIVPTGDAEFPHLISAPTMRVPEVILDPTAVRLAMRAAIRAAIDAGFSSVVVPGLGSGCGQVKPGWVASYMAAGLADALKPAPTFVSFREALKDHNAPREQAIAAAQDK